VIALLVTADEAFANWPTLDEACGCENCRCLFRRAENAICPHCGSESIFDAAAALNVERTSGEAYVLAHFQRKLYEPLIARLDEVLNAQR
jgi:hypothetical protein